MQPAHNPQLQFPPSDFPYDAGNPSNPAFGGIAYSLQPIKTICGVRRRVFFVILAAVVIALVAGLGAGLGVAVSKNNNNSAAGGASTVTVGASAGSPSTTTGNRPDSTPGSSSATSTPSDDTRSTPTDNITSATPSDGPAPTDATRFPIRAGFWTITFSKYSTSGDLCTFFNALHPVSTVVEPWVFGNVVSGYKASWTQTSSQVVMTEPPTTVTIEGERYSVTGTFSAQAVTNVPAWDFKKSLVPTVFGCEFTGSVHLLFEETGRTSSVDLPDSCTIGSESVPGGSTCSLYWRLIRSKEPL
ncbi:uncharacterized protein DFL_003245 [Arthrobotrys flagrans]|uniref:Uncharacterized protein n=1 Tax=Arthrobotrys flagrans TaxID=97331 RepID=A0A437A191_ARTFL|nr:hypothetical protein DFL_003245 [Arthrobotrys flagrans]